MQIVHKEKQKVIYFNLFLNIHHGIKIVSNLLIRLRFGVQHRFKCTL